MIDKNDKINRSSQVKTNKLKDATLLKILSQYTKHHYNKLIIGVLALLITLILELCRPLILKYVIDKGFITHNFEIISFYALIYFLSILIGCVSLFLENYFLEKFGQTIIYEIRNIIFSKLLYKDLEAFNTLPVGNWVTRVTNDVESLRTLYTDVAVKILSNSLFIIGILCAMYFLNFYLALVMTALLPIMGLIIVIYQRFARKAFRKLRKEVAASNSSVQDILNFIVTIKTYVGESFISNYYDQVSQRYLKAGLAEVKTFAIFRPIVDALYFVALIAVFAFTNYFDSVTEAGVVFAFIQYMDKFFQPIKEIAEKYNSLQSSLAGAERLVPILMEETPEEKEIEIPKELKVVQSIVLEHVYFSYQDSNEYVLKDINLSIKEGDFIGIVGQSGAGKSTLLSLLMGIHKPTKGRILINGYDMSSYDGAVIRSLIGYVFQNSHLFKGTIRENLSLYDEHIDENLMVEASKKVGLHDIIMKLPNCYDTPVGYLGSLLSSGQKQLLAFARTLLKDKTVLLLDEATANIDSHTEHMIQESIETIRGEKIIINIAHRLSTIEGANTIYVMEAGKIIEKGNLHDLLHKKGIFYKLWTNQNRLIN